MPVLANVKVSELRRGYNNGRATGQTNLIPALAPTYIGQPINFRFHRYLIVDYVNMAGHVIARFQDKAAIDD